MGVSREAWKRSDAMLRSCGKRLMVAMAGVVALMWIWAGLADAQTSQRTPVFARIVVSEQSVVYIRIQGDELRAATSVEGLQIATPVKLRSEFALPVPADQLPAGVTAIKAKAQMAQVRVRTNGNGAVATKPYIYGQLTVCRTDDQKAVWQYVAGIGVLAGADAENAPSIKLPNLHNVKATVRAQPANGKLGVGLQVVAGGTMLVDVRKDDKPVQAKVIVTDASGAVIASKTGPLSAFGFS
jgi:hypothetical protein